MSLLERGDDNTYRYAVSNEGLRTLWEHWVALRVSYKSRCGQENILNGFGGPFAENS